SSLPEIGLNLTSTNPFSIEVSLLTHHGNVPLPDCLSTFGGLGAVSSFSTVHLGEPRPVTPDFQPAAKAPTLSWSKLTVSPIALSCEKPSTKETVISDITNFFMIGPSQTSSPVRGGQARHPSGCSGRTRRCTSPSPLRSPSGRSVRTYP